MSLDLTKIGSPDSPPQEDFIGALRTFAGSGVGLPPEGQRYDNTSGFRGKRLLRRAARYPNSASLSRSVPLSVGQADRLPGDWGGA